MGVGLFLENLVVIGIFYFGSNKGLFEVLEVVKVRGVKIIVIMSYKKLVLS